MSNSGWTDDRRARQAALIRTWKPWTESTGPRTPEGKAKASRNAWSGGNWWRDAGKRTVRKLRWNGRFRKVRALPRLDIVVGGKS